MVPGPGEYRRPTTALNAMDAVDIVWLRSEAGQAAVGEATTLAAAGLTDLAIRRRLERTVTPSEARSVLMLAAGRAALRAKWKLADRLFADRDAAEQAAHELVAAHTAARFAGCRAVADLGCGMGADTLMIARALGAGVALAVDRDPGRLAMAEANAGVMGVAARVRLEQSDLAAWRPSQPLDGVWLDPARRDGRGRLTEPERWSPPLSLALGLATAPRAGIKLAPGIDLAYLAAELRVPWEVEFVSLNRALRAAVLWLGEAVSTPRRATVIEPSGPVHTMDGPAEEPPARLGPPGAWLYDPDPAVGRAGLVRQLAASLDAWQLDSRIAYLSGDAAHETPFARRLRILSALPYSEGALLGAARDLQCARVEVERRGSPVDTNALERRLNARLPGGPGRVGTIALTRSGRQHIALICAVE